MRSILIGNGFDIQYGGSDYINKNIIMRAIDNVEKGEFPCDIYPKETADLLRHLFLIVPSIISGEYDRFIVIDYEQKSLIEFKKRYKNLKEISLYDIGIEDYFFIYELFSRENRISNPERFDIRQALRRMFVDSIYNKGNLNKIIKKFPHKLRRFLFSYDNIFTTNYDNNIEKLTKKKVDYLHGAFHYLDEIYNVNSFRNMLSDIPVNNVTIHKGYEYLYSNILMTYAGELKQFSINMHPQANLAIEKFISGLQEKPELVGQIEEWKNDDNIILRNMYEAISIGKNMNIKFEEYYPVDKFRNIKETIDIIGLYPNNDSHIFNTITENEKIDKINFYFYDKLEVSLAEDVLKGKIVAFHSVKELWKSLGSR